MSNHVPTPFYAPRSFLLSVSLRVAPFAALRPLSLSHIRVRDLIAAQRNNLTRLQNKARENFKIAQNLFAEFDFSLYHYLIVETLLCLYEKNMSRNIDFR